MNFREGIARSGLVRPNQKGTTPFETGRAALTYPARLLLWTLTSPRPQGRTARITYSQEPAKENAA